MTKKWSMQSSLLRFLTPSNPAKETRLWRPPPPIGLLPPPPLPPHPRPALILSGRRRTTPSYSQQTRNNLYADSIQQLPQTDRPSVRLTAPAASCQRRARGDWSDSRIRPSRGKERGGKIPSRGACIMASKLNHHGYIRGGNDSSWIKKIHRASFQARDSDRACRPRTMIARRN